MLQIVSVHGSMRQNTPAKRRHKAKRGWWCKSQQKRATAQTRRRQKLTASWLARRYFGPSPTHSSQTHLQHAHREQKGRVMSFSKLAWQFEPEEHRRQPDQHAQKPNHCAVQRATGFYISSVQKPMMQRMNDQRYGKAGQKDRVRRTQAHIERTWNYAQQPRQRGEGLRGKHEAPVLVADGAGQRKRQPPIIPLVQTSTPNQMASTPESNPVNT